MWSSMPHSTGFAALVAALLLGFTNPASAFLLTEDADTADGGEVESETFAEVFPGDRFVLVNQEFNLGATDRFQPGIFSGIGYDFDAGEVAVANPGAQLKVMLHESDDSPVPSVGVMVGGLVPWGVEDGELPGPAAFGLIPMTFGFDPVAIHAHAGWAFSDDADFEHRPLAGLAAEIGVTDAFDTLIEVVNADPVEPTGPPLAFQGGVNVGISDGVETWLLGLVASDTTGDQSLFDEIEVGAQLGLRLETRLWNDP